MKSLGSWCVGSRLKQLEQASHDSPNASAICTLRRIVDGGYAGAASRLRISTKAL